MWEPYEDQGVTVLGVNVEGFGHSDDTDEILHAFVEQGGLTFPLVHDAEDTFQIWGASPDLSPFPLDVVIDRTGVVRYVAHDYQPAELRAAIDAWK